MTILILILGLLSVAGIAAVFMIPVRDAYDLRYLHDDDELQRVPDRR